METHNHSTEEEVSIKSWFIQLIILVIPIVNVIMCIVWAFDKKNKTKNNFYKALIIFALVCLVISGIASVLSAIANIKVR